MHKQLEEVQSEVQAPLCGSSCYSTGAHNTRGHFSAVARVKPTADAKEVVSDIMFVCLGVWAFHVWPIFSLALLLHEGFSL